MAREIVYFIIGMGFGMWIIMFLDYAIDWYWQRQHERSLRQQNGNDHFPGPRKTK